MIMSEYGLIEFLEEYIEALKKPIRFKYSNEEKIEMLKLTIELINKQHEEIEYLKNPIICGRTIDEIVRILNGLDIEKQYKIDVTMENLYTLMDLYQNEMHKHMQLSFESITKDILNPDVSGYEFTLTLPKFKFKEDTEE